MSAKTQTDEPILVLATQGGISVERNARGDIWLEQEDALGNEPDTIVIARENVPRFIDAIRRLAGDEDGRQIDAPPPASYNRRRDRTNAERQRRYRERHSANRNAATHNAVTPTTEVADDE